MTNMTYKSDPFHAGKEPLNKFDAQHEADYWTNRGLPSRPYFCNACGYYHLQDGIKGKQK